MLLFRIAVSDLQAVVLLDIVSEFDTGVRSQMVWAGAWSFFFFNPDFANSKQKYGLIGERFSKQIEEK